MLKADLYTFDGKKKESINFPKEFDVKPNLELLSQAVRIYEDRTHLGLAKVKTRGEVRISTRKIYKQKGTGGARHGAKSAPIFVGGGVAHGPKGIKRLLKLSGSQKNKALLYALNYKIKDSLIVLVDNLEKIKKTKEASFLVENILKEKNVTTRKNVLIAFSEKNLDAIKAFRNLNGVVCEHYKDINVYKVFLANILIIDKEALTEKIVSGKEKKVEDKTLKINKPVLKKTREKISQSKKKMTKKAKPVSAGSLKDKAKKTKKV